MNISKETKHIKCTYIILDFSSDIEHISNSEDVNQLPGTIYVESLFTFVCTIPKIEFNSESILVFCVYGS